MNQSNNVNIPIYSDSTWVPFIAKADFWGDSRASQLSFRREAHMMVDRNLNPNNGWRWGKIGQRMGWFPEWAAEPMKSSRDVSPRRRRSSIGRSKDRIVPMMSKISEQAKERSRLGYEDDETDTFNMSSTSMMGSTVSTADSSTGEEQPIPRKRLARRSTVGPSWKDASWKDKWNAKDMKELDWDGSEQVPKIVGEGESSSYRSQRSSLKISDSTGRITSYQRSSLKLSDSTSRLAEKMGLKLSSSSSNHSSKGSKSRRRSKFSSMPEFLRKSKPIREEGTANAQW